MPNTQPPHPTVYGVYAALESAGPMPGNVAAALGTLGSFGAEAESTPVTAISGLLGGQFNAGAPQAQVQAAVRALAAGRRGALAPAAQVWQVLFLTFDLSDWLLIRDEDIAYSCRVQDRTAPDGLRDYVWVRRDALIARGDSTKSPESLFLSGAFTRAGDFQTSLRGDTNSSTGLACELTTPGTCGLNTRH